MAKFTSKLFHIEVDTVIDDAVLESLNGLAVKMMPWEEGVVTKAWVEGQWLMVDIETEDEEFCSCPDGSVLGNRIDWAKPRCSRCHLFIKRDTP